jgi:hypothetical protein
VNTNATAMMATVAVLVAAIAFGDCGTYVRPSPQVAADFNSAVIGCDAMAMSRDEKIVAWITGSAGILLVIATPKFSRDVLIAAWLCWGAFAYGFCAYRYLRRFRRRPMTVVIAMVLGSVLGALAGFIATVAFPPEKSKPEALELVYKSHGRTWSKLTPNAAIDIFLIPAELFNASEENMVLTFKMTIRLRRKDGTISRYPDDNLFATWEQNQTDRSGPNAITLPHQTSINGVLRFKLAAFFGLQHLSNNNYQASDWPSVTDTDMVLEIRDQVSGKTVLSSTNEFPSKPSFLPGDLDQPQPLTNATNNSTNTDDDSAKDTN